MMNQVPREIYVVSLDRAKHVKTPMGNYVIQHLRPELFEGYETRNGVTMATPEKSVFDTVYLLAARGRRYVRLPELEIPKGFQSSKLDRWIKKVSPPRLHASIVVAIEHVLRTSPPRRALARTVRAG